MDLTTLRRLVGTEKFDAAITVARNAKKPEDQKAEQTTVDKMGSEPDNDGLTLEEGREALKRAANRDVDLPHPSVLFKR